MASYERPTCSRGFDVAADCDDGAAAAAADALDCSRERPGAETNWACSGGAAAVVVVVVDAVVVGGGFD